MKMYDHEKASNDSILLKVRKNCPKGSHNNNGKDRHDVKTTTSPNL